MVKVFDSGVKGPWFNMLGRAPKIVYKISVQTLSERLPGSIILINPYLISLSTHVLIFIPAIISAKD